MTIDVEKNYALFKKWVTEFVTVGDPTTFAEWLDTTDFKVAPASTKYHLNVEGGLCQHSLDVFKRLIKLMKSEYGEEENWKYDRATIALVGLLNGLSKIGTYKKYARNVRNDETGQWETVVAYTVVDDANKLICGNDVDNTLKILRSFFDISDDVEMAIRYHRGAFAADTWEDKNDLSLAFAKCPLALLLHIAETQATYIDENEKEFDWAYDINKFLKEKAEREAAEEQARLEAEQAQQGGEEVVTNTEPYTQGTTATFDGVPF